MKFPLVMMIIIKRVKKIVNIPLTEKMLNINLNQKEIGHCEKIIVVYKFIYDHIKRTSGKRSWGDKSPRYVYNKNQLVQNGFFSDFPFKIIMKIRKNFRLCN